MPTRFVTGHRVVGTCAATEGERMATKATNQGLSEARRAKKDEFYTQLPDIERELRHYKKQFEGKVVYCNCDDPRVSNFFHYFSYNFEKLGLKKLITTCYRSMERDLFSQNDSDTAIYLEYNGDKNDNRVPNPDEIGIKPLMGDGDFRSPETVQLLKQADIVVTNPPFSLFREYVGQLMEHDKQFLIIGHQNAITYREIFPLIQENRLWLGYGFKRNMAQFASHYENTMSDLDRQEGMIRVSGVQWFTNMDTSKRHEDLILYKTYDPEQYPKYDNFDAIEVGKTSDIPMDYDGLMGVPVTFLEKYNPDQFRIVGSFNAGTHGEELGAVKTETETKGDVIMWNGPVVNRKPLYKRIIIQSKK
jgi:hypothetical protein